MNQNYHEFIFLVPWIVLLIIAFTMFVQGWMIMNAHHGYSKSPKVKHPELNDVKPGDTLLSVKFVDKDLKELQERIQRHQMENSDDNEDE